MPHKHSRKGGEDAQFFNLPPSTVAKPLPAFHKTAKQIKRKSGKATDQSKDVNSRSTAKQSYGNDDTPKAFARLMHHATNKRPRGLDDGDRPTKKAKSSKAKERASQGDAASVKDSLKLLPGERMSDFAARVNQAIPVSGLAKKGTIKVDGLKERRTKTEKRLHKMYADWREEDAKIRAAEEELAEKAEEENEDMSAQYGGQDIRLPDGKRLRRKRAIGEIGNMDDDPWAILKSKQKKHALNDVVQEPPQFKAVPKEKFKVRNGAKVSVADVPTSAGSLQRREALGEARREVIERYRSLMKNASE